MISCLNINFPMEPHPSQSQSPERKPTISFFKPFFKDYEHQFKIIKSTYEREKSFTSSPTLIINILAVFDKDINRCIKSIEELFKQPETKDAFTLVTPVEIEKKVLNKLIPEFIEEKKTDFTFEQVTLCLHFLFHLLHKIKKVPAYFYQDCVFLILILSLQESLSKKAENLEKKQVEKKYLFDLAVWILLSVKMSLGKVLRKKMLNESLADLELASLYVKYKEKEDSIIINPARSNSFVYIDNSPIAKEKQKMFKFEKLIVRMLKMLTRKYKIVDQQSNFHKDFLNSFLDFAIICFTNHFYKIFYKIWENNNSEICFKLKNQFMLGNLNKLSLNFLKIISNVNIKNFIGLFSKEKMLSFLKNNSAVLLMNLMTKFIYDDSSFNENIGFDVTKMKIVENKEKLEKMMASNKKYYQVEERPLLESVDLKPDEDINKITLVKNHFLDSEKISLCFKVLVF